MWACTILFYTTCSKCRQRDQYLCLWYQPKFFLPTFKGDDGTGKASLVYRFVKRVFPTTEESTKFHETWQIKQKVFVRSKVYFYIFSEFLPLSALNVTKYFSEMFFLTDLVSMWHTPKFSHIPYGNLYRLAQGVLMCFSVCGWYIFWKHVTVKDEDSWADIAQWKGELDRFCTHLKAPPIVLALQTDSPGRVVSTDTVLNNFFRFFTISG